MQFMPQLAAMKLPQGDHFMKHNGARLSESLGRAAAGCDGGMQLSRTEISPLGTWNTIGCAEQSQMAAKNMQMVLARQHSVSCRSNHTHSPSGCHEMSTALRSKRCENLR